MLRKRKKKLPRLDNITQIANTPVFLVTFNTFARAPILASDHVQQALELYCRKAADYEIGVGRYVIMPDHVHLFVSFGVGSEVTLGEWIKGLKRQLSQALVASGALPKQEQAMEFSSFWQPGFHDYLLRGDESYAAKWDYVRENPVRAGLVSRWEDWRYQGEIVLIDRV